MAQIFESGLLYIKETGNFLESRTEESILTCLRNPRQRCCSIRYGEQCLYRRAVEYINCQIRNAV